MSPKNKLLWLFSGTSDGNQIAKDLIAKNCVLKVFVATPYGRNVAVQTLPLELIHTGRLTVDDIFEICLLYTSPSPRDGLLSRMPSSA